MTSPPEAVTQTPVANRDATQDVLSSVHTRSFTELLRALGVTLVVSTYQAGKLVFLRADDESLNTHFRTFPRPMGIASHGGRLWIGTGTEVWEFHNSTTVARSLSPEWKYDGCFLPRRLHITGDILIHEMSATDSALWLVNTRFSCLCTLDGVHSFVPQWQPPFVSELRAEDRCHLNGLAMRNNSPAFVTALGVTNEPRGWRENKRDGGVILEIDDGEVVARGLSMPHSPRWHDGQLWVLESGTGSLGVVDLDRGKYEPIVRLPGFTRGLDMLGRYAFVGLSQVRESATFGGLPITERGEKLESGVWVVDICTAEVIAVLKFEGSVQEVFEVHVLEGMRYPELIHDDSKMLADTFIVP